MSPVGLVVPAPELEWPLYWDWPISLDVGPPQSVTVAFIRYGSSLRFAEVVSSQEEPRWWTVTSTGDDRRSVIQDGVPGFQFYTDNAAGSVAVGWRHPYYRPNTADPAGLGSLVNDYKSRCGWWRWNAILPGGGASPLTADHGTGLFVDRQAGFSGSDPWPGGASPSALALIQWDAAPSWVYRSFDPAGAVLETVVLPGIPATSWTTFGFQLVSGAPGQTPRLILTVGGTIVLERVFGSSVLARIEDFADAQGIVWGQGMGTGSSAGAGGQQYVFNGVRFRSGPQLPDGTPLS